MFDYDEFSVFYHCTQYSDNIGCKEPQIAKTFLYQRSANIQRHGDVPAISLHSSYHTQGSKSFGCIPCASFGKSCLCSLFEISPHLFEFRGGCVGIVSEVGELGRVWFGGVCRSWGIAFGDETDVFGVTPSSDHPQFDFTDFLARLQGLGGSGRMMSCDGNIFRSEPLPGRSSDWLQFSGWEKENFF